MIVFEISLQESGEIVREGAICRYGRRNCSLFAVCKLQTNPYFCFMKTHNGMRPQDIVILLKILTIKGQHWQYRDLAASLFMSISEISESLSRSHLAGLVDETKKKVRRQSLMEFIEHGLHYVFPQIPGRLVTGIPTAHAHPFYSRKMVSDMNYVWPYADGPVKGQAIQPLYKTVAKAVQMDDELYKLLASIDIIRVGNTRELKLALLELRKGIL